MNTLPEFVEERLVVERFAVRVIEVLGSECVSVMFLPWSQEEPPPEGVIAPLNGPLLDMAALRHAAQGKSMIVAACTFLFPAEEAVAPRIVAQLLQLENKCILGAHLLPNAQAMSRQQTERTMEVLQRIIATRVNDVLMDPGMDARSLRLRLKVAHHSWAVNNRHIRGLIDDEYQSLHSTHQQLLWKDIPGGLLQNFPRLDVNLVETENHVGAYSFVSRMQTTEGGVWNASDANGTDVAIKVVEKEYVHTPGEVEAIHRELSFLICMVKHPNIVRGVEVLHGRRNIYIVMEHGGEHNLEQHLDLSLHNRMATEHVIPCFGQVASALVHLHGREIVHRNISLSHVVVRNSSEGILVAKLCDFRLATLAKGGAMSRSSCGKLPYMAPEVLIGMPFRPLLADIWSAGVLLLEMAGGLNCFFTALNLSDDELDNLVVAVSHRVTTANRIQAFFSTIENANHEYALTCMGAEQDATVWGVLKSCLREPEDRISLEQISRDFLQLNFLETFDSPGGPG